MTICLSNPNIPAAVGGAPLGLKLIRAQLSIRGVFTTPSAAGDVVWRAIATPWGPGADPGCREHSRGASALEAARVADRDHHRRTEDQGLPYSHGVRHGA